MTGPLLGLLTGLAVGAVMTRGGLCLNSALRRAAFEGSPALLRAFGFAIAIQLLALPVLVAAGLDLTRIGFFPVAQVAGGLAFGAGMALAGGCIAGILWRTGAGSVATAVALLAFAAGELAVRGPGEAIRTAFDDAGPQPAESTAFALLGVDYQLAAVAVGISLVLALAVRSRSGLVAGVSLGGVAVVAWLTAAAADHPYGLGFAGSVDGAVTAIERGEGLDAVPFPTWVAAGLIAGAFSVTRGPLRLPDLARLRRALGGGLLMGAGATVAHGCNIGHALTGIPLLSLGSLWATVWIAVAALATWRLAVGRHPGIRGRERPVGSPA